MKKLTMLVFVVLLVLVNVTLAGIDSFGTGANQFTIDFVDISGDSNPASGYGIVNNDYRIGIYEITNEQWNKFTNTYGTPTGSPCNAYGSSTSFSGIGPINTLIWHESAQFVNYLNTSTGHQAAYKFTGTQGTDDYTLGVWESGEAGYDADNPYRNSNAYYFLPTEDEWVKAAYWNGASLQTYATKTGEDLTQGDGTSETGWNYYEGGYATTPVGLWDVGSGSEELNGTFDMMGNAWEWMENSYSGDYLSDSGRIIRGGSFSYLDSALNSVSRFNYNPLFENPSLGFRVASIPEPCSLVLLSLGGLMLRRRNK